MTGQRKEVSGVQPPADNGVVFDRDELAESLASINRCMSDMRMLLLFLSGNTSCVKGMPIGTREKRDPQKCWAVVDYLCGEVNGEVSKLIQTMATARRPVMKTREPRDVKRRNVALLPINKP